MKKYVYTLLFAFSSLFIAEAQQLFDLKRCIETGLEQNYSIRIIRNEQQISDNNATPGNAGYLPTVDMSGGVRGEIHDSAEISITTVTACKTDRSRRRMV